MNAAAKPVATSAVSGDWSQDRLRFEIYTVLGRMKNYEVIPLQGVFPVALGMTRGQVHSELGRCASSFHKTASSAQPTDAWFNNSFQVFYAADETVKYIELSCNKEFSVSCMGVSVFNAQVTSLIERFEQYAAVDTSDPEHGFSFIFPSLELSLWRPEIEGERALYFSTIGIGKLGCYSNAD